MREILWLRRSCLNWRDLEQQNIETLRPRKFLPQIVQKSHPIQMGMITHFKVAFPMMSCPKRGIFGGRLSTTNYIRLRTNAWLWITSNRRGEMDSRSEMLSVSKVWRWGKQLEPELRLSDRNGGISFLKSRLKWALLGGGTLIADGPKFIFPATT